MCRCKEVKGAPIWGATCKCSHASVYMTGERMVSNSMVRSWECRQPNCSQTWEVNMGFESQDQLEGRI